MELRRDWYVDKILRRMLRRSRAKRDEDEQSYYDGFMYFTYVLESRHNHHYYVGVSNNVKRRLSEHNGGKSIHTNKYKPWSLRFCAKFTDRKHAELFEKYLKSHAGRAWMSKHLNTTT